MLLGDRNNCKITEWKLNKVFYKIATGYFINNSIYYCCESIEH